MAYHRIALLAVLPAFGIAAQTPTDRHTITLHHETVSSSSDGGSSSESGGHEYVEEVAGARPGGTEYIYDLPSVDGRESASINWQFPVRVLERPDGSLEILNRADLERRRDAWLKDAGVPPSACGSWYFTWSAFQIECDPDAILETIKAIRLRPLSPAVGDRYEHAAAREDAALVEIKDGPGRVLGTSLVLDPEFAHRTAAQGDVVVGEIMRSPVSFETALAERRREKVTGTIEIVLEMGDDDMVDRRTVITRTEKADVAGIVEKTVSTEITERTPLPQ